MDGVFEVCEVKLALWELFNALLFLAPIFAIICSISVKE